MCADEKYIKKEIFLRTDMHKVYQTLLYSVKVHGTIYSIFTYTHRNVVEILLNQTEMRLYLPSFD